MPIILIEGADAAGKTTLAEKLSAVLGVPWQPSPMKINPEWQYEHNYYLTNTLQDHTRDLIILDRAPEISEPVYAYAMGRQNRLEVPVLSRWLNIRSNWRDLYLIIVRPPAEIGPEDNGPHFDVYGDLIRPHHHDRVRAIYDFLPMLFVSDDTGPNTFTWFWNTTSQHELAAELMLLFFSLMDWIKSLPTSEVDAEILEDIYSRGKQWLTSRYTKKNFLDILVPEIKDEENE